MTGVEVYRTAVADLKLTTSADQIAARANGHLTTLPSLEIGLEEARQTGNCDNGYSCAYTYNVSWKTETQPLPPISDPKNPFERLFSSDIAESPADRRKLDEYLTSVREIEVQVEKASKSTTLIDPGLIDPGLIDPGLIDPGLIDPGLIDQAWTSPSVYLRNTPTISAS